MVHILFGMTRRCVCVFGISAGSNQLLSLLTQQQQQEVLEHQQLMDALESMNTTSPVSSPAQAAGDAFRSCFTSSTQITSSSGRTGSSGGSSTGSPFKHYPSLPDLSTAEPQAGGFNAMQKQQQQQQERGTVAARAAAAAAAGGQCGSRLAAAGAGPQQLNADDESDGELFYSTRQGGHKLQRAAQQAAAAQAEAAEAAAEVRQLNWQMLQRLRQREAAAAVPVASYPISHNGTEIRCARHRPRRQQGLVDQSSETTCQKACWSSWQASRYRCAPELYAVWT